MEQYKEGLTYSYEVKNAVRYGYQYRKEAEDINQSLKCCLPDASDVLLWLGNAILGGYMYDKIKILAKNIKQWLKENKRNVDQETATILENEEELKVFYEYVVEFNEHRMSVTEEQKNYIKEEIFADYGAAKEVDIIHKKGRMATLEERKVIYREALIYAEKLTEIKN